MDLHSCALHRSGAVECWGKNVYGQLGNGTRQESTGVVKVRGVREAKAIAVGRDFSCALRRAGTVLCWGNNEDGQLGNGRGAVPGALSLTPVPVRGLKSIVQISLGEYHACARDSAGRVRCWGNSGNGQLGETAARAYSTPLLIKQLRPVRDLSSGANHVCAVETSGAAKCWGRNTEGQLGDGNSGSKVKPVAVKGVSDGVSIGSGNNYSCVVTRTGAVKCWGDNASRQLGEAAGSEVKRRTPVALSGVARISEIAGGKTHSCARMQSGRVACWGGNTSGQLGHTSSARQQARPRAVRGVGDAIDISLGAAHTCAVRKAGTVVCWGSNDHGALGPYRLEQTSRVDAVASL